VERWRYWVVGYLLWLIAFAVVEGTGRQVCRVPSAKWIAAAADGRDRTGREWFRDRARACLDATPWYTYAMRALVVAGLTASLGAVWAVRRRGMLAHSAALAAVVGAMLGSIAGVRWLYDWLA
jgi:hypothetical protein